MISEKTSQNIEKTTKTSLIKESHFTNNEMQLLVYYVRILLISLFLFL